MLDDSLKSKREAVRQIDRQVVGQTDKRTDRQRDRQTNGYCLKTVWLLYESLKPTVEKKFTLVSYFDTQCPPPPPPLKGVYYFLISISDFSA